MQPQQTFHIGAGDPQKKKKKGDEKKEVTENEILDRKWRARE